MSSAAAVLPVLALAAGDRRLHVVVSPSTFRKDGAMAVEAITPVVEEALERARVISGASGLVARSVRSEPARTLVESLVADVESVLDRGDCVLWLRVDDEDYARATLAVLRARYDVSVADDSGHMEVRW